MPPQAPGPRLRWSCRRRPLKFDFFIITKTLTSVSHPFLPPPGSLTTPTRPGVLEKKSLAGLRRGASKLMDYCKNAKKHHSRSSRLHRMIANLVYVGFCMVLKHFCLASCPAGAAWGPWFKKPPVRQVRSATPLPPSPPWLTDVSQRTKKGFL